MEKEYEELLKRCEVIIKEEYAPCGLENEVKQRIKDILQELEKRKRIAQAKGRDIGGHKLIFSDLLRAVNQAKADSKRFRKPLCYYLKKGFEKAPTEKGGLGYWFLSFRN